MQCVVAAATGGDWLAGALFGTAFFIGREHAQAERRCINALMETPGEKVFLPELRCISTRYWSADSVLDFVVPLLACAIVASVCINLLE